MQDLAGKTAFVTGGASGIGLGIAKALLGEGMKVVIADVREDHLEDAREELDGRGDVLPIPLDVTDREAFARAADETEHRFGRIHLLVNNAGVAALGPVELAAYGDWDWTLGVCLGGTINGIVTILPRILAHLAVTYVAAPACGTSPLIDAVETMCPPSPCARIRGRKVTMPLIVPPRHTPNVQSQSP